MWTIYKKLNVSPNSYPLVIPIKQYSSDFILKIKLYSTDGDLDIEAGATTKIRGTKRDGNGFELTGTRIGNTCTFSGTKAQMQQMTAAHGRCVFEVVVEHDGKELITANFYMEVQRAAMDAGTVTSESIIEEFADFQSKITAAQAAATAAQEQADRAEAAAQSASEAAESAKTLTIDSVPTQGSTNAVSSGGVWSATSDLDARVENLEQGESGLTNDIKSALLQIAQKVAYIDDDGQTYYNDLYNALYPPATLISISAVYTQSGEVYDTDTLDSLKTNLVVTGRYSDSSTSTITDYVLSGTLVAGTSTITVSYSGKTTTFNVTVSERSATLQSITATFTQGSAVIYTNSSLNDLKPYLVVTANYSDSTTQTVTGYTLSGTLTAGTSTITVSYGEKTTTFNVTVSERSATLQSITATFTQGSAVIYTNSSLDDLKPYLTVTARYSDSTTQTVTGYTLSGTLTAGTSTITASYGGMTDTFSVTVTDSSTPIPSGYTLKSYVQSNGDAYIDTGYRFIAGTTSVPVTKSFEGKFAVSAVSENKSLFGYQGTPSGDVSVYRFMSFIKTDGNLYYYGKGSGVSSAVQGWEPSGINEISVYFNGYFSDYPVFIINGVQTTGDKNRPLNYSSEQGTVYLCAQNYKASGPSTADTAVDGGYIRCYGFKIQDLEYDTDTGKENESVVMDFKPCVRNSDGVAGFYETVNCKFYPSIGGNAFVAGD